MAITLRDMTQAEYDLLAPAVIDEFAADLLAAGHAKDLVEARAETLRQVERLLPDGLGTEWMLLLVAEDDGVIVGQIWLSLPGAPGHADTAWVYNVVVNADHRGKGYGRAIMAAAEVELQSRGIAKVGLNVFGSNKVAIGLYDSLGYEVTSQQMSKQLG